MSLFVEVQSIEKSCTVIINLEHLVEIAPLSEGGCALFFNDSAAVNGVRAMKVKDNYTQFKQFVMQTVTSEMISNRIEKITANAQPKTVKKASSKTDDLEIPKL
jgi:uncharacterized protein YktA (UPF0223 family)